MQPCPRRGPTTGENRSGLAWKSESRIPMAVSIMPFGRDPLSDPAQANGKSHSGAQEPGERVVLPGHDEAYAKYAERDFPPEVYPEVMARVGIDYMIVYPSIGLLSVTVPNLAADTAAAYRRAYNNWLHDFCSAAGGHP